MQGLNALFGKNPHQSRAQVTAGMLEHSGFAKPFLAAALGADMAKSAEWDEQQGAALQKQAADKADMEFFQAQVKNILELSTKDHEAANIWLDNLRATGNPHAAQMEGIRFAGQTNKDGYLNLDRGDKIGVVHVSAIRRIGELQQEGMSLEQSEEQIAKEGLAQFFPKGKLPEEGIKNDFDLNYKVMKDKGMSYEQIGKALEDRKIRIARESRPPAADSGEKPTIDMKELTRINADRRAAGQPELTLEAYKERKFELNDPYGVKQAIKGKMNQGAPRTGAQSTVAPPQKTAVGLPQGAVLVPNAKTTGGKPVYKLPTGQYWSP